MHCRLTSRVIDTQQELDEYTENSASLEKELEASLEQVERQNKDLENQNQRLKNEIELLRVNKIMSVYHTFNVVFAPNNFLFFRTNWKGVNMKQMLWKMNCKL